jgi:hypothetical protein
VVGLEASMTFISLVDIMTVREEYSVGTKLMDLFWKRSWSPEQPNFFAAMRVFASLLTALDHLTSGNS